MSGTIKCPEQGIPLTPETLAELKPKECAFWNKFLQEAQDSFKAAERKGSGPPYVPSDPLKVKFQTAIGRYGGERYCQVTYLQNIFSFK